MTVIAERTCSCVSRYCWHHQQLRKQLEPQVDTGLVQCWRCGVLITAGTPWDLGHDDDNPLLYRGPEHRDCNRATAGRHGGGVTPHRWVV